MSEWEELARRNAAGILAAECDGLEMSLASFREAARGEVLALAREYSAGMGIPIDAVAVDGPWLSSGHQPVFFHPGVWVKSFLADEVARRAGGLALELVADTDASPDIGVHLPCDLKHPRRCDIRLAGGSGREYFAAHPAPTAREVERFVRETAETLETLGHEEALAQFVRFAEALEEFAPAARDLGAAVTGARRLFETRQVPSGYLSVSVREIGETRTFRQFAKVIAARAEEFARIHDEELVAFRREHSIRSASHPFPNLGSQREGVLLPLWHLEGGKRRRLRAEDAEAVTLESIALAPDAITLTMFARLALCDLFIHGAGGSAYDVVTERVCARFFGIHLPPFAAATLTMRLFASDLEGARARLADANQWLHQAKHNPDKLLGSRVHDDEASGLLARKAGLIASISSPGADKKALGSQIGEVNLALAALLEDEVEEKRRLAEKLEADLAESAVLADRTYPFCFWSPKAVRAFALWTNQGPSG